MDAVRKEKLGQKWICFECGSKFYDLNRPEALCPKCGKSQKDAPVFEVPKRARSKKAKAPKNKPKRVSSEKETGLKLSNEEEELAGALAAKLDDELEDDIDDDMDDDIDIIDLDGDAGPDEADADELVEEEVL